MGDPGEIANTTTGKLLRAIAVMPRVVRSEVELPRCARDDLPDCQFLVATMPLRGATKDENAQGPAAEAAAVYFRDRIMRTEKE